MARTKKPTPKPTVEVRERRPHRPLPKSPPDVTIPVSHPLHAHLTIGGLALGENLAHDLAFVRRRAAEESEAAGVHGNAALDAIVRLLDAAQAALALRAKQLPDPEIDRLQELANAARRFTRGRIVEADRVGKSPGVKPTVLAHESGRDRNSVVRRLLDQVERLIRAYPTDRQQLAHWVTMDVENAFPARWKQRPEPEVIPEFSPLCLLLEKRVRNLEKALDAEAVLTDALVLVLGLERPDAANWISCAARLSKKSAP